MIGTLADIIDTVGRNTKGRRIISFGQDRLDADVQGSVALFDLILREKYGSSSVCFYSKQIAFAMSRMIDDMLPGLFRRAEHARGLAHFIGRSPSVWVWDTTNFSQMSAFDVVLQSSSFKRGNKRVYMIDHHIDNNEGKGTGNSPSDYGDKVRVYRYETGANTSIVIGAMRQLGVDLQRDRLDHQARGIAAYLAIDIDTQGFQDQFLTDHDRSAIDYLEHVLTDASMERINFIKENVPQAWVEVEERVRQYSKKSIFSSTAVYGIGVIDDFGIFPHTADYLLELGYETSIVFGILRDCEGASQFVTLNGSGRTRVNDEIDLPNLFGEIFYEELEDGSRAALGGGRPSDDGKMAMCAGEQPLPHLNTVGPHLLRGIAWPHYSAILGKRIREIVPGADRVILEGVKSR